MSSHVPLRFALVSVATLFSFGVVAYFSWSFFKSRTSFKKPHHGSDSHNRLPSLSNDPTQAFDVEDEEEEEEEEDDEDDDEEHEKEIRDKYDQQIGLAKKLLAGNAFKRAAEAFSEAIKLVEQLPSAEKDLTILYNNRSAMYEKQNLFNESLSDIEVVLFREPNHIKARSRRARIFDAQVSDDRYITITMSYLVLRFKVFNCIPIIVYRVRVRRHCKTMYM